MKLDLLHNKLIAETMTEAFRISLENGLVPLIEGEYTGIEEIQMYEDYLTDSFELDGYWYYPMTVVCAGTPKTVWVRWNIESKALFDGKNPYSYKGTEPLEFSLAEPPAEFKKALEGRAIYFEGGCIKLVVDTSAPCAATFLSGKYSQSFIDEMARQLTREIARAMSVEGLAESNIELRLIFAPDTYMEHTCENVTYRRLLITDKGCGVRDFWIKWTRNNSAVAYSISDHVSEGDVTFEIGEDVSQKIREREYRFLVRANTDKYHYSMGRKNVTEWRELVKRAIRRGDLTKVVSEIELAEHSSEVHDKLSDLLARFGVQTSPAEEVSELAVDEELDLALNMVDEREAEDAPFDITDDAEQDESFDITDGEPENAEDVPFDFTEEAPELDVPFDFDDDTEDTAAADTGEMQDIFAVVEDTEDSTEDFAVNCAGIPEDPADDGWDTVCDGIPDDADITEEPVEEYTEPEEKHDEPVTVKHAGIERVVKTIEVPVAVDEARIRAEIEAKLRLEYETAARRKAEEEASVLKANMDKEREESARLRREHELLIRENEKLVREREALALQKATEMQRRKEEEQRLRDEIEARKKAESRELERLEEAARLAVENQRKAELERLAEEKRIKEAEELARKESERRAEQERLAAERLAEAERINRDAEISRGNITPAPAPAGEPVKAGSVFDIDPANYTYTSKTVTLIFKGLVDPNLIKKIQEIMLDTVKRLGKEKVSIRVKARTVDERTVALDFIKVPEEELQLLIDIVNTLGKSNIGIIKATIK